MHVLRKRKHDTQDAARLVLYQLKEAALRFLAVEITLIVFHRMQVKRSFSGQ